MLLRDDSTMKPIITALSLTFIIWLFSTGEYLLISSGVLFLASLVVWLVSGDTPAQDNNP